jgi:hypothetical protein
MSTKEEDEEPQKPYGRRHDDRPARIGDSGRVPLMATALAKSMDFKIPVWGVLCLFAALAYWLISMDMQQKQILQSMAKIEAAVQTGNNQTLANTGELAIMKFRMEKVEADHARMLSAPVYKPGRD